MKTKGIGAIIVALLVVFGAVFGVLVLSSVASAGKTSQGLYDLSNYTVNNEVSSVWGYNSTAHTWHDLSFTKGTSSITVTTPLGQQVTRVLILTQNASQDVYHLLQNGLLFSYSKLSITSTGGHANLSSAYMYFGTQVNDTGTTSLGDKGVSDYVLNQTLYGPSVDNFGHNIQLSAIPYFASNFAGSPQYAFYLNQSKNATGVYSSQSLTFTQYFEYAQHFTLVSYVGLILLVFVGVTILFLYMIVPEHYGEEEQRAKAWQTRRELPYAMLGLAIILILAAVVGFMGTFSPLFGWGGAIALLFGFGLFVTVYTSEPTRQRYSSAMVWGISGAVLLEVVNLFVPFGPITYNLATSGSLIADIAGWMSVLVMLGLAYIGLINTKRYRLRERSAGARSLSKR